jgi:hypothetical protein
MLSIVAWDGISRSGFATSIYLEIDWFFSFLGLWNEKLHEDEEEEEERNNNRIALRNWQGGRLSLEAVDAAEPSELPRLIYFGGYKGGRKKGGALSWSWNTNNKRNWEAPMKGK